jgi:hypothetical protein
MQTKLIRQSVRPTSLGIVSEPRGQSRAFKGMHFRYLDQCHERLRYYVDLCNSGRSSPDRIAAICMWDRNLCGEYVSLWLTDQSEPRKGEQEEVERELYSALDAVRRFYKSCAEPIKPSIRGYMRNLAERITEIEELQNGWDSFLKCVSKHGRSIRQKEND